MNEDPTTIPGRAAICQKGLDAIKVVIVTLATRWMDEKEHEDITEYGNVLFKTLKPAMPEGTKLVRVSKKPFGIIIEVPKFPYQVLMFQTMHNQGWKAYHSQARCWNSK